jgi:hypothetical protein
MFRCFSLGREVTNSIRNSHPPSPDNISKIFKLEPTQIRSIKGIVQEFLFLSFQTLAAAKPKVRFIEFVFDFDNINNIIIAS